MITDHIKNAATYKGISERMDKALDYLATTDLSALEVGRYELDGDNLFVLIQAYEPKNVEDGRCEAHKKYIDIQYIIEGQERMGYGIAEDMAVVDPYDDAKDRYFVEWTGDFVEYSKDMFAVFYPQDAHMPGIEIEGCSFVKKAVVKIKA